MALDELKESDLSYDIGGFQYVVEKEFMEQAKPIVVDFTAMGFKITSSIDLGPGCSGSCDSADGCG